MINVLGKIQFPINPVKLGFYFYIILYNLVLKLFYIIFI